MNPLVGPFPEKLIQSEQLGSRMIRSTCLPLTDPSRDSSMMSGSEQIAKQTLSTIRNMQKTITFWNTWSRNENVEKKSGPNIKIWAERIPFSPCSNPCIGEMPLHTLMLSQQLSAVVWGALLSLQVGLQWAPSAWEGQGSHTSAQSQSTLLFLFLGSCAPEIFVSLFFSQKDFCRRRRDSEDSFEIML